MSALLLAGPLRTPAPRRQDTDWRGWVRLALACLLLQCWAGPAQAVVLRLAQAQSVPGVPGAAPAWAQAVTGTLPDDWQADLPGPPGERWYRLALEIPAGDVAASAGAPLYALYVERACSVLRAWLNGQFIHDGGNFEEPVTRNCHRPQLIPVPAALLRAGPNTLDLRVKGYRLDEVSSRQRAAGLSDIEFGPYELMAAHHARRLVFAIRLPEVMSGALVLMGSFMFVMGWFNRAQSYLAYFGALMVGWSLLLARLWVSSLPVSNALAELGLATHRRASSSDQPTISAPK